MNNQTRTAEDLESIIAKWPKELRKPKLETEEYAVLQIMYDNSKVRYTVSMRDSALVLKLGLKEPYIDAVMQPLIRKRFVSRYSNISYSLRSEGLEIFESPYTINTKLTICLHDMQAISKEIGLPDVARASALGEFTITRYYLKNLADEYLVNVWESGVRGKKVNSYKLTGLGWSLAEYLIKVKNEKPKLHINGFSLKDKTRF